MKKKDLSETSKTKFGDDASKLIKSELISQQSEYKQFQMNLNKYDTKGMLIGEAPCTEDLIKVTDHDFNIVNSVSIVLVGLIIIFVFRSASLPILLVSVIEFAIFINMGIPHYTGHADVRHLSMET